MRMQREAVGPWMEERMEQQTRRLFAEFFLLGESEGSFKGPLAGRTQTTALSTLPRFSFQGERKTGITKW